jgi:hypothetical protein
VEDIIRATGIGARNAVGIEELVVEGIDATVDEETHAPQVKVYSLQWLQSKLRCSLYFRLHLLCNKPSNKRFLIFLP